MPRVFCYRYLFVRYAGKELKATAVPVALIIALFVFIPCLIILCGAFAIYEVRHDDVLNALINRHIASDYAYEEKIAFYRAQLDRLATHQLLDQDTLEGKVNALMAREHILENRSSVLATLADHVTLPPDISAPAETAAPPANVNSEVLRTNGARLPIAAPVIAPVMSPAPAPDAHPRKDEPWMVHSSAFDQPLPVVIADLMQRMSTIEQSQNHAVASIGQHARQSAKILRTTLAQTGLNEQRFAAHHPSQADTSAEGGPLIELATDPNGSAFERSLHDMRQDIMSAQYLIANLPSLPLRAPLIRNLEQTSPFGMRIDPFTGRYAMHTGIDLRDGIGTPVRSTAAGIVIFAGTSGGYGNMVEIDHGHGLTTRYGHLQSIIVHEGEHVSFGSFIGQLGSTGRSTGPHLHYEVRIDGEAVDPTRFLSSGRYLYHS